MSRRRRARKIGDISALKRLLWEGVRESERAVKGAEVGSAAHLRAIHALTQAGGQYLKCLQAHDFEQRLERLEARHEGRGGYIRG